MRGTFHAALKDSHVFKKIRWAVLIVDEGHRLKNQKSALYEELGKWRVGKKTLLTGTPLQNNMQELFNLLQFLDPSHNADKLHEEFSTLENQDQVKRLHEMIQPHILRRLKRDVLKGHIPEKVR